MFLGLSEGVAEAASQQGWQQLTTFSIAVELLPSSTKVMSIWESNKRHQVPSKLQRKFCNHSLRGDTWHMNPSAALQDVAVLPSTTLTLLLLLLCLRNNGRFTLYLRIWVKLQQWLTSPAERSPVLWHRLAGDWCRAQHSQLQPNCKWRILRT